MIGQDSQPAKDRRALLQRSLQSQLGTIQKVLAGTCVECHSRDAAEADVVLESTGDLNAMIRDRATWESVYRAVEQKEMPPNTGPKLSQKDRQTLLDFLRKLLYELDCGNRIRAGAVTLRRLNRFEYRNSIRDLFSINYENAVNFPGDDVGNGFDSNADTLSLPPLLLEKYLDAAEKITHQAIIDPATLKLAKQVSGSDFQTTRGSRAFDNRMMMTTNGIVKSSLSVPSPGIYEFDVDLEAMQAGPEPVKAEILINGRVAKKVTIPRTRSEYRASYKSNLKKGEFTLAVRFVNDFYDPDAKDRGERDRNLVVVGYDVSGPTNIKATALPASQRKIVFTHPDEKQSPVVAARRILKLTGFRIFRRPLTKRELDRFVGLFEQADKQESSFEASLRIPIQAMLVSPHFLFRIEQPAPASGQPRALNDYELATAISFFICGSTPDDELLTKAFNRKLSDPVELEQQVRRLLEDPRSDALVDRFARQWLNLDLLKEAQPDPDQFPGFNDKIRADMMQETLSTFRYMIRKDRSILELLTADYTFVNQRLAKFYGFKNVQGQQFRKVALTQPGRGGIVTQGSIMTLTSHPNRTSPVRRGMWVLSNLLGQVPPPPDPDVMSLESQTELRGTLRQKMEQHRKDPSCAACHDRIDPLGFAFENLDPIGRWREKDAGGIIDASSQFADGQRFNNAVELQTILAGKKRKQFVETFVSKVMTYAIGRGMTIDDRCTIVEISQQLEKKNYRFSELILLICRSDPFRKRQLAPQKQSP